MLMSMGWLMIFIGIILVPLMVIHIIGGARALRQIPAMNKWIYLSSFLIIAFVLIRPDMDDTNSYTGYSSLMHFLDFRSSQYVHVSGFNYYLALILLLLMAAVDINMIRKGKKPPSIPVPNEFV